MKKILTVFLLLLALGALLLSCTEEPPTPDRCEHSDADADYLCDVCRERLPVPECTSHVDTDADYLCDRCESFVDKAVAGWLIKGVPGYPSGTLSKALYLAGQGINTEQPKEGENVMQVVKNTTAAEFNSYLSKLEKAGYDQELSRTADTNLFASYVKEDVRVYAYFMSRTKQARIVKESTKTVNSVLGFSYAYHKRADEQSVLYQFALAMNDATHAKPDFKDNGMLYILKLADNSVVIIDGGNSIQMPDERRDALMQFLWEITDSREGDTVRIAGWYVTHAHGDHYGGFVKFVWKYAKYLQLERVFFAFPSLNSPDVVLSTGSGADGYRDIIDLISKSFADDDPLFLRLHTGQSFQLADATFEVLQTHEDLVDPAYATTKITNYNDSSCVLRVSVDGATFLFTGDINQKVAMAGILSNWSESYLRTDGVQLAHHVMNDVTALYEKVQPSVLFVPQSRYGVEIEEKRVNIMAMVSALAREDMIFYQNEATVGIAVVDGRWEKVYESPFSY